MLNRRLLRFKAMQALFALQQKKEANFNLAQEIINDCFAPDLMSPERPDYAGLEEKKKEAWELFSSVYTSRTIDTGIRNDIKEAVEKALDEYDQENKKEAKKTRQQLLTDTDHIQKAHIASLQFLVDLARLLESLFEKNNESRGTRLIDKSVFIYINNPFIGYLLHSDDFQKQRLNSGIRWDQEDSPIRRIYREHLSEDQEWNEYLATAEPTLEQHQTICLFILKKYVFKDVAIEECWSQFDFMWDENMDTVKNLAIKTVKSSFEKKQLHIMALSENWDEDRDFMLELYDFVAKKDKEVDDIVAEKLQNWDLERVALTDRIILEMAVVELLHFPSIPIKVTINEYIELSKKYSTPKSRQFINGLLDAISKQLVESKRIRKSGRGLMDSK